MTADDVAALLVFGILGYAAIGVLFAIAFVSAGVGRIDDAAQDPPLGFRLLLLPGSAALWPMLLRRWIKGSQPPVEINAHRAASQTSDNLNRGDA